MIKHQKTLPLDPEVDLADFAPGEELFALGDDKPQPANSQPISMQPQIILAAIRAKCPVVIKDFEGNDHTGIPVTCYPSAELGAVLELLAADGSRHHLYVQWEKSQP